MVNTLLLNPDNIQLLSTILEDCDSDMETNQEFALTVIEKMFTLYLKRSFSFVKDLAVKKDKKKTTNKKAKALRKELKRFKEGN